MREGRVGDRESRTGTPLVCVTDGKPEAAPEPLLDVAQAVRAGWLELWPKIDARGLAMRGAEALLHIRHPAWGIVAASYFIPNDGDPRFHPLSESVIRRAVEDWSYFVAKRGPIETAINLPIAFLQDPRSIGRLCKLFRRSHRRDQRHRDRSQPQIGKGAGKRVSQAQDRHLDRQSRSGVAPTRGHFQLSLCRAQSRPEVHLRLRRGPVETIDLPAHRRACRWLRRTYRRRRRRDLVRFSHGSRHGLRSGARVAVR
jgi:hypothetical protein